VHIFVLPTIDFFKFFFFQIQWHDQRRSNRVAFEEGENRPGALAETQANGKTNIDRSAEGHPRPLSLRVFQLNYAAHQ